METYCFFFFNLFSREGLGCARRGLLYSGTPAFGSVFSLLIAELELYLFSGTLGFGLEFLAVGGCRGVSIPLIRDF